MQLNGVFDASRRPAVAGSLAIVSVIGAVAAQVALSPDQVLLPVVGYVVALGVFLSSATRRPEHHAERAAPPVAGRWKTIAIGLLLFSVLPLTNALAIWQMSRFTGPASNLGLALFALGVLAICGGLVALGRAEAGESSQPARPAGREWLTEAGLVGAVFLIALFLRFYQLADVPYGIWWDEADTGMEAFHTYEGEPYSPVAFGFKYNASLYYYLVFLGYKAIGPGLLAIRGVTALLGALGVLAVYPLGRLLFGRRIALVAMFLLAVMRWHVDFSRFGMFNVMATVLASLALYFLVKAFRTGRWSDFGWAGLTFGLGFHSYLGFQVLALVPVVLVLGHVLSQRGLHKELAAKLSFCFVMVLVILAPLGLFAVQSPQEFLFRNVQTSLFNEKKTNEERLAGLRSNVEKHLLMFNYRGDRNARHNLPYAPMLDPVTGGLFVLGVGHSLLRIREQRHLMLLTWVGAGLMAGIMTLTFEAPQGARTIVITPALALLAAVPLGMMLRSAEQAATRWHKPAALAVGAALLAFAAYHNYDTYFEQHMKTTAAFYEFSGRETAMGRYIAALDPNEVYCYLQSPGERVIRILNYGRQNLRSFDPWRDLPLRQSVDRDAILLFEPWRVATPLSEFQRYYPRGAVETVKGPDGQVIFHAIRIKPEEVTSVWGLTRRHYPPGNGSSGPTYTTVDRRIEVDWDRDAQFAGRPLNVVWEGTVFAPESGEYTLVVETNGAIKLSIDGADVLSRPDGEGAAEGRVSLPSGLHALELRLQAASASGTTRLYWQRPKAAERQLIPAENLSVVPLSSQGLRRQYFNNPSWSGLPDLVGVDQAINFRWHPLPVRGPQWTADWRGQLRIDREGEYTFLLQTNDFASMSLDGQEVFATPASGGHRFTVRLTPGQHDVLLRYRDTKGYAEFRWRWIPPGGREEVVPADVLTPARR